MKRRANPDFAEAPHLTEMQVRGLLAYIRRQADQARRNGGSRAIIDEVIVLTLLHAGLRPQELCVLRIGDTPAHHGRAQLHVPKGPARADRVISIPQEMVQIYQRFVHLHRKGARPQELLLLSERGTPLGYMSLYSKVRRIGQEAGLAYLQPGMLRHTFLVRLYEKEQDLRLVQDQAGHARLRSTARHVGSLSRRQRCEACGTPLRAGLGKKIDSGQLLCPACLREFHRQ
jgi:integrase